MATFSVTTDIRWADIDPNFHVLHSRYYDFCATARMKILSELGVTMEGIQAVRIGPIILREECVFKRELKFGDTLEIRVKLRKADPNFARWSFENEIWKNGDTLAAVVTVDGAWMDLDKRKLAIPPDDFKKAFAAMPHTETFNQ